MKQAIQEGFIVDVLANYTPKHVDEFVERHLRGEPRDRLDPLLDVYVGEYFELPDEDNQVKFKGNAKAFLRTYNFLSTVLS